MVVAPTRANVAAMRTFASVYPDLRNLTVLTDRQSLHEWIGGYESVHFNSLSRSLRRDAITTPHNIASSLTNLHVLDLNSCTFSAHMNTYLPSLTQLTRLSIISCEASDDFSILVLSTLTTLRYLDLSDSGTLSLRRIGSCTVTSSLSLISFSIDNVILAFFYSTNETF